ncbi:hypothetical protein [Erythrobacter neustonensis]|nr:hypothetical protein [Erythrobacter neustonensis]
MMPAPETLAAVLIGAGAALAAIRWLVMRRDLRTAALALLTLASGALLYLTLFPPMLPLGGERLIIATAETPATTKAGVGERLIALPEAPPISGAERVPDLATALRRHPRGSALTILGRGLTSRDREQAAGLPTRFTPLPAPRGLVRLDPPADTPAGAVFVLGGAAHGLAGGWAELLDPSGARVDRRVIGDDGGFTLGAAARAPGLTLFTLRLRSNDGSTVSETPVPLRTLAEPEPVRLLLIGAPSPENKYLRRWAEDAGLDVAISLAAGGGVDLGDGGARLDPGALAKADVVIIDDSALGGGTRAALARAVAGGLGVVVRMTGPATGAARQNWRALGIDVGGGGDAVPLALAPLAEDAETLAVRRGPAAGEVPASLNTLEDPMPDLARFAVRGGGDFVPALRDAEGAVLAGWQQRGQGRAGLWAVAGSFALVLGGQQERYYQWWSTMVSAVARPTRAFRAETAPLVMTGERTALCGLTGAPRVRAPDGRETALAIDPRAGPRGCAAYWPERTGVHTIIQPGEQGERTWDFAVVPAQRFGAMRAAQTGEATARWAATQRSGTATSAQDTERRGPAWPWLLGWLAASSALWLAERRWRISPA